MKKKNLKALSLNKSAISNLRMNNQKGGIVTIDDDPSIEICGPEDYTGPLAGTCPTNAYHTYCGGQACMGEPTGLSACKSACHYQNPC